MPEEDTEVEEKVEEATGGKSAAERHKAKLEAYDADIQRLAEESKEK